MGLSYISDDTIEKWIQEDVPYFDLTTHILNIAGKEGKITFSAREETVLCGTEEVARIFSKLNIITSHLHPSGTILKPGEVIVIGQGLAEDLHTAWKISINILEYASGIASRTYQLVKAAKAVNPDIEIVATRKGFPGTKELSIKAVLSGSGLPHRLGLSETVLIFDQHNRFLDTSLEKIIPDLKKKACEKKIIAEPQNFDEAITLCKAGIDGIQFDKVAPDTLKKYVIELRKLNPSLLILAAGGINLENAAAYADSGVNALSTSSMYFGKPADIKGYLEPI